MLELTGKQETLEEFRRAKVQLRDARHSYDEAAERLRSERNQLRALDAQARQHSDFVELTERKTWIDEVGLPAAQRLDLVSARKSLATERDGQATALERNREEVARLDQSIPALGTRVEDFEAQIVALDKRDRAARKAHSAAAETQATAEAAVRTSTQTIEAAVALAGEMTFDDAAARAASNAAAAARDALRRAEDEYNDVVAEISELEAGRPRRPPALDEFRAVLADRGIDSDLIAERLEVENPVAGEAVLGDGVWGLVVGADRLDEAVGLATGRGYRLPIVSAGGGYAGGALAGATGLDEVGGYLAEIDLPLDQPGVSREGVVRGKQWAAFRAPEWPVLGQRARAARLAIARVRANELDGLIPGLRSEAEHQQSRALAIAAAVPAAAAIEFQRETLHTAEEALAAARAAVEALGDERAPISRELGRIEEQFAGQRSRKAELEKEIRTRAPQIETYDKRLNAFDEQLAELPGLPEDLDIGALGTVDTLSHESVQVHERLADEDRFPPEVRSQLVLAHQESQARKVTEVEEMLEGRREDLDAVVVEVDRARQRYDQHIRQVVAILAKRFREVCGQAGMDGDIELRPGETEGEFGIDVKVAHVRGEAKRSYRSSAHSSGQRAKISLLILLAAMGLEGSADLLIMDEHAAHLDSRNIDAVAEVMNALKDRVQFILATPTNAEAGRLSWCDNQIAFYPRPAGEPFAPPIRLFTRRPADEQRYADMGQMTLAG